MSGCEPHLGADARVGDAVTADQFTNEAHWVFALGAQALGYFALGKKRRQLHILGVPIVNDKRVSHGSHFEGEHQR